MKALQRVKPTPEQLPLVLDNKAGVMLIRGSAGSGKTTTALLRLKQLAGFWLSRRKRLKLRKPVRFLTLTYNRTLRGYVAHLAKQQVSGRTNLQLKVSTFGKWSTEMLPHLPLVEASRQRQKLATLCRGLSLPMDFLMAEIDYILGRFLPSQFAEYLSCRREGRGVSPRVDRDMRQRLLEEVVYPYGAWKKSHGVYDWNDLAVILAQKGAPTYDVIIADEAQDLSANQVRALMKAAADPSSVTFVLDAAQRIYPRGFTWREAGVNIRQSHRLKRNYRNTIEICRFALPLLDGIDVGDDGTFPDFKTCNRHGPVPVVLKGKYSRQLAFAMDYLRQEADVASESVAFLKPKGGNWFRALREALSKHSFGFVDITRRSEWPQGRENIALSTMYSAKGLEFDHVLILGLNEEVTPHGADPQDSTLDNLRRLLAMAITRARKGVVIGYKPSDASSLIGHLAPATYRETAI